MTTHSIRLNTAGLFRCCIKTVMDAVPTSSTMKAGDTIKCCYCDQQMVAKANDFGALTIAGVLK